MKKQFVVLMSALLGCFWLPLAANAQVSVVTSIRPLALIAEELLAPIEGANVEIIVPQNASPHGFSLKPSHLRSIITAPTLIWLGASFEPYLDKAISKRDDQSGVVTVETLKGIKLLEGRSSKDEHISEGHIEGMQDGHDHHHHGGGYDPHLWWSSANAITIANGLADRVGAIYPEHQQAIQKSLMAFTSRLTNWKQSMSASPKTSKQSFVVYHDSLIYLEQELNRSSKRRVTESPEEKPSIKDMLAVKGLMNRNKVTCIIMEPNASQKFLEKVKPDDSVRIVTIDPLGWDTKNYSDMWFNAANTLKECSQDN